MREFSVELGKSLSVGLRPDERTQRNVTFLQQMQGLRPKEWGAVGAKPFVQPLDTLYTPDFPFPQVFIGRQLSLVAEDRKISAYNAELGTLSPFTFYDAADQTTVVAVEANDVYHLVDLFTSWLLIDGRDVYFRSNLHNISGSGISDKYFASQNIGIQSGCYHRGRVFFGGFTLGATIAPWGALGENQVWYGHIGGGDVFWPFFPALVPSDATLSNFDRQSNDSGVMTMENIDKVLSLVPLGNHVIAYGESGVNALVPTLVEQRSFQEIVASAVVGVKGLASIGLLSRGAVCDCGSKHLFVSEKFDLWQINEDLSTQRLGYKAQLAAGFLSGSVSASWDPDENEAYFSSNTTCFVLTDKGLGEENRLVSSIFFDKGELSATVESVADAKSQICTDVFDFSSRALKFIQSVEVGGSGLENVEVRVDVRFGEDEDFYEGDWIPTNENLWAFPQLAGQEFKVLVRCDAGENAKIDYLNARWKAIDNRNQRGIVGASNVNQANAG